MDSLKSDVELFSRLYISCQIRDGNLEEFFRHENQAHPPVLSDCGKLHLGNKSDLLTCLELENHLDEAPLTSCTVLVVAAIVQMLKPGSTNTFAEYASQIFIPYISSKFQSTSCVDLVWDRYMEDTLKVLPEQNVERGYEACNCWTANPKQLDELSACRQQQN